MSPNQNSLQSVDNKGFDMEMSEQRGDSSNGAGADNNANVTSLVNDLAIKETTDEEDLDLQCGIWSFRPTWIQSYATRKMFLAVFSVLGVIQGMSWSYFTATITTMEKRFKISSQTTGIIMTGNEVSQILFSLVLSYYGGKGHRPRWIAVGVLFSALACFVMASPHMLYGSGDDALSLTEEYQLNNVVPVKLAESSNRSWIRTATKKLSLCQHSSIDSEKPCSTSDQSIFPLLLIFLSQFVSGIGHLLYFSLGGPYLDDNTKRTNLPIVFGISMSLRLVGPTFGFLIASATLKVYINPFLKPYIGSDDPRWVGAWWLGWVIFGILMTITSGFIALFPKRLKRKNTVVNKEKQDPMDKVPKLSDIPVAVKALLRNKINLFNTLAGVFYLFASIGYWTYMPKYLENIFMQTPSRASIISGGVGILCKSIGILVSGFVISKWQPSARKLAAWNVIVASGTVVVKVIFTQIGCEIGHFNFGEQSPDGAWTLKASCNSDCQCKDSKIFPVCYKQSNTVFFSPCHAGCTGYNGLNQTITNCSCLPNPTDELVLGNCSEGCTSVFLTFLAITAFIKLLDSSGRVGNMLVSYRCVDLKDRSLSIGLNILLVSLIATLPSPILFGTIIDSVCMVWGGASCGKKGNCMLYYGHQLRYLFNLTAAGFTLIGLVFDCLVWYYVKDLKIYEEKVTHPTNKEILRDK